MGAFVVQLGTILKGVGEDGDETTGALDEPAHGPSGEGKGFSGLAAPHPNFEAVGAVEIGFELVRTENERGAWSRSRERGACLDFWIHRG